MDSIATELLNEKLRPKALKKYDILDTPKDAAFDRITRIAAVYMDVPFAMISIVDDQRIWFKSAYGFEIPEIKRESGLCASAIQTAGVYEIENAAEDNRTQNNPLVTGMPGIRFYAALPLKTLDGHNLGTLCVMDKQPGKLTDGELMVLTDLRDIVMELLELRTAASAAVFRQRNMLNMTVHDLKNPLSSISLRAQFIIKKKDNAEAVSELGLQIWESSKQIVTQINNLLLHSGTDLATLSRRDQPIDLSKIVSKVVSSSSMLASYKEQDVTMELADQPYVMGDEMQLYEIVDNLVSNAIKYCFSGGKIHVSLSKSEGMAIIKVSDNGPGFSLEDHNTMFQQFATLSARPTGEESSSGLGLSIVRQLVEQHRGQVYAEKNPLLQGAHIVVELPALVQNDLHT